MFVSGSPIDLVQSGQRVFIHGGAATPFQLIALLVAQADRLKNVEIIHLHTLGLAPYADSKYQDSFRVSNLFIGENIRKRIDYDRIDYLPCFLSEIPVLFRSGRRPLDVALVHVSPPDIHGYCSLGVSVDVAFAAVQSAKIVIAQINPRMPRVHGEGLIHISKIHASIEVDTPLPEAKPRPLTEIEKKIGQFTAGIVEDGATLQVGIGAIPDAALAAMKNHKHLGIHTEMWSDGVLELIKCGAVDNSKKKKYPGRTVSGFMMGSQALYDYVHDNPSVVQLDIGYVNDPAIIKQNPKVTAINSAVEIDLTGQVCADSIGHQVISGVGGQMDFMRGAACSVGGKPIIALTSQAKNGVSRITAALKSGAGVVTTRCHVHYVVTEYGVADLYGMTLRERANALIKIAHPDHRESLERDWHEFHTRDTF